VDLRSGALAERETWFEVTLPAFGLRLYQVLPSQVVSKNTRRAG
jgi:hypothetical protein